MDPTRHHVLIRFLLAALLLVVAPAVAQVRIAPVIAIDSAPTAATSCTGFSKSIIYAVTYADVANAGELWACDGSTLWVMVSGAFLVPGNDTEVIFNDGGSSLGTAASLTFDDATGIMTVQGDAASTVLLDNTATSAAASPSLTLSNADSDDKQWEVESSSTGTYDLIGDDANVYWSMTQTGDITHEGTVIINKANGAEPQIMINQSQPNFHALELRNINPILSGSPRIQFRTGGDPTTYRLKMGIDWDGVDAVWRHYGDGNQVLFEINVLDDATAGLYTIFGNPSSGLVIDNAEPTSEESSPTLHFSNGGATSASDDVFLDTDSVGTFHVRNDGDTSGLSVEQDGDVAISGDLALGQQVDADICITFDRATDDHTFCYDEINARFELDSASIGGSVTKCRTIENLAAADTDRPIFSYHSAVTLATAWCQCEGTCTTEADITLETRQVGTASTVDAVTGTITCEDMATAAAEVALSGAGATVDALDIVRFDVAASPVVSPETDTYILCWKYSED